MVGELRRRDRAEIEALRSNIYANGEAQRDRLAAALRDVVGAVEGLTLKTDGIYVLRAESFEQARAALADVREVKDA